jgi:uncharacterized repeat protein (TIGR03843 family)
MATPTEPGQPRDSGEMLRLLCDGELEIAGRLADASNATFLCRLQPSGTMCVYKPVRGERPLDDFPLRTLANRELAAFRFSEATGWRVVPPTVVREGPYGPGMVQLWMDSDPAADVLAMVLAPDPRLRPMAVFDVLVNNADRKGSHLLPQPDGHVYGVDHGVTFADDPKLRTVLWGWRGQPLTDSERDTVERIGGALDGWLGEELSELLSPVEVSAAARRARSLLRAGRLPQPDPQRPAIPWPPF